MKPAIPCYYHLDVEVTPGTGRAGQAHSGRSSAALGAGTFSSNTSATAPRAAPRDRRARARTRSTSVEMWWNGQHLITACREQRPRPAPTALRTARLPGADRRAERRLGQLRRRPTARSSGSRAAPGPPSTPCWPPRRPRPACARRSRCPRACGQRDRGGGVDRRGQVRRATPHPYGGIRLRTWTGCPSPLGATPDGERNELRPVQRGRRTRRPGARARRRHASGRHPLGGRRLRLARLPARCRAGQRYGYRVHGPWDPAAGHRCDPAKLLLDPYARAVEGQVEGHIDAMLSVVTDPSFDWGDDRPPGRPYADTVIYEAHVRGLTRRTPTSRPTLRGTYAGLAHRAGHRPPHVARRDRRRADAGAPVRAGRRPARPRPDQLLGLQHHRLLRPAPRLRGARRPRPSRSPSSSRWSRRCTRPASR